VSDEKTKKASPVRPRRREDDPTRPIPAAERARQRPDTTMDLDAEDIEIIAGEEVLKGEPTKPRAKRR
jgi:hypothetical protein